MKIKFVITGLLVCILSNIFTGCTSLTVTMPYGSDEYVSGNWTVDEIVTHFEDLGFTDIETSIFSTYDKDQARICRVAIDDDISSWSPEYVDFKKGDEISTMHKILISAMVFVPTLTIEDCAEFAEIAQMGQDSPERQEALNSFMREHDGEFIELVGTISSWDDEYWYSAGGSFSVLVDGSNHLLFSWRYEYMHNLKLTGEYHYTKYTTGLITAGMRTHIIAKIDYSTSKDNWHLEIDKMEIID